MAAALRYPHRPQRLHQRDPDCTVAICHVKGGEMSSSTPQKAMIRAAASVPFEEPPEHYGGARSRMLVRPEPCGSRIMDYRVSVYEPGAYVAPHRHRIKEQVY